MSTTAAVRCAFAAPARGAAPTVTAPTACRTSTMHSCLTTVSTPACSPLQPYLLTRAQGRADRPMLQERVGFLDASKVFEEMPRRDIVSWSTAMAAMVRQGEVANARWMSEEMPEKEAVSWDIYAEAGQ
ncbi:hypothetical protein VPH35_085037 [Triticum aestivum]